MAAVTETEGRSMRREEHMPVVGSVAWWVLVVASVLAFLTFVVLLGMLNAGPVLPS